MRLLIVLQGLDSCSVAPRRDKVVVRGGEFAAGGRGSDGLDHQWPGEPREPGPWVQPFLWVALMLEVALWTLCWVGGGSAGAAASLVSGLMAVGPSYTSSRLPRLVRDEAQRRTPPATDQCV